MQALFEFLGSIEVHVWGYIGFPIILLFGGVMTWKSRCLQMRRLPEILREFVGYFQKAKGPQEQNKVGLNPLKAFVASIGGCMGIGNLVGVATAIQIGGPGALFWIWVTAVLGSIVKYCEVYVALLHRKRMEDGSFRGGPMFFLQDAFGSRWPAILFCGLLSLYGVEIYQFNVVATVTSHAIGCSKIWTVGALLFLVFIALKGGLKRVSSVASFLVPIFLTLYLIMGGWVLWNYASFLPSLFADVFHSAFTPRAAEGGFIGCTLLMTITQGIRRGCYSADIGVGYASIIHSETTNPSPIKQARLLIVEVFVDTFFICTMSAILVLITGVWKQDLLPSQMVQQALATRFPYMHFFMPVLLTLLGYSTVLTYLSAGMKSATYLSSTKGKVIFSCYALFALSFFSFVETSQALSIMSFINLFLLILNSVGIWRLRREIVFDERQKFSELVIDQT